MSEQYPSTGDDHAQDCSDGHDDVGRVAGVLELQAGPEGKDADAALAQKIDPHKTSMEINDVINEVLPINVKGEGHVFET
jgi:hypothetical protein